MKEQPRLRIQRAMSAEAAAQLVKLLMSMDEPPTFAVTRTPNGVVVWFSKRTYAAAEQLLRAEKRAGVI